MKLTSVLPVCIMLLLYMNVKAGTKTYTFTYDANGNRTTVAFSSTCNANRQANPADTIQTDTLEQAAVKNIKTVVTPSAYPNPVRDYFILSFPVLERTAILSIYDQNNNEVYKDENVNTQHSVIKTCGLPAGMYTIVVQYAAEKPFVQKMIKL